MKHIDENIALPSIEEIEMYHKGTLDHGRAHEIELLAHENPLVADALEGFMVVPAFTSIPSFEALKSSAGTTSAGVVAKSVTPWWHLNGWIIGLAVGAGGALLWTSIHSVSGNENLQSENKNISEIQSVELSEEVMLKPGVIAQNSEVNYTEQIKNESEINQQQVVQVRDMESTAAEVREVLFTPEENLVNIPGKNPEPEVLIAGKRVEEAIKPARLAAVQIAHINGYKVADYSELRPGGWKPIEFPQTGTNASMENKQSGANDLLPQSDKVTIAYMDYLAQCMNEYHKGEYSASVKHFGVILKQYPGDVNALFYGSMAHYHAGNYHDALSGFESVLTNVISVFNEETRFYKAKSLKALGMLNDADILFTKIVSENGFYAEKAVVELSQR